MVLLYTVDIENNPANPKRKAIALVKELIQNIM